MSSARLQTALLDLADRYRITAADLTPDEIILLVHACERVDSPFSQLDAELMERPVWARAGVCLWPATLGAHIWLMECAADWWPPGSAFFRFAQIYALVHARDPQAFTPLTTKSAARAAIIACLLRFTFHIPEILRAVDACYGLDPYYLPKPQDPRASAREDFYALAARLEVSSGIPLEKWLWGRSIKATVKSYVELSAISLAAFGGKNNAAHQELDDAIENLARVMAAIATRLEKQKHATPPAAPSTANP